MTSVNVTCKVSLLNLSHRSAIELKSLESVKWSADIVSDKFPFHVKYTQISTYMYVAFIL